MSGKQYANTFFTNGHLERVEIDSKYADRSPIAVKHYLNGKDLAFFPDFNVVNYGSKIIGGAKKSKDRWNSLPMRDKVDYLEQMGTMVCSNSEYDALVAQAGGFPIKNVRKARHDLASYLKDANEKIEPNPGRGPLVAATSVTTPHVQKWAMIEGLFGNTSVTIKGDNHEPFSAYDLADIVSEFDPMPPVQFITYNQQGAKKEFAKLMYEKLCVDEGGQFMLMGNPETARRIGYGELWEKIPSFPPQMFSFISHGGAIIIDKSADVNLAVENTLQSFEFPKACKVPTILLVDETVADAYTDRLVKRVGAQSVGDVLDEATDVAYVSETYWAENVDPFLRTAKAGAEEILLGGELNKPTVLRGYFDDSPVLEPGYPIYCIESYEGLGSALEKINMMGKAAPKGKILDLSIQTEDNGLVDYLNSLRWGGELRVFSIHQNLPTFTLGAAHESVIPRKVIAEHDFFESMPNPERPYINQAGLYENAKAK